LVQLGRIKSTVSHLKFEFCQQQPSLLSEIKGDNHASCLPAFEMKCLTKKKRKLVNQIDTL